MQNYNLLGETKLVPPRKGKNANCLSIEHIHLRVARDDLLGRLGEDEPAILLGADGRGRQRHRLRLHRTAVQRWLDSTRRRVDDFQCTIGEAR